jgi:hypothetical protein
MKRRITYPAPYAPKPILALGNKEIGQLRNRVKRAFERDRPPTFSVVSNGLTAQAAL